MLGCDLHPQQIKHHSSWNTQAPAQCRQEQQHTEVMSASCNCILHKANFISGAYKPFQCKMYLSREEEEV